MVKGWSAGTANLLIGRGKKSGQANSPGDRFHDANQDRAPKRDVSRWGTQIGGSRLWPVSWTSLRQAQGTLCARFEGPRALDISDQRSHAIALGFLSLPLTKGLPLATIKTIRLLRGA